MDLTVYKYISHMPQYLNIIIITTNIIYLYFVDSETEINIICHEERKKEEKALKIHHKKH